MGKISVETDKSFLITLPGFDVNTADPEDFAVHSGFDYPKMEEDLVGVVDYTVPASLSVQVYTIATITHNLGYTPMSVCFVEDVDDVMTTEFAILPFLTDYSITTGNVFHCYTNDTQLKLTYSVTNTSAVTLGKKFKFKYQCWINS